MAQQDLDGPQVGAGLEQVGREAVAQRVDRDLLAQAGGAAGAGADLAHAPGGEGPIGAAPGKRKSPGRAAFQEARRTSSSRGESMT